MIGALSTVGRRTRRVGFVVLAAFDARVAWAVIHASVNLRRNTGLFWTSIGLLRVVFLVVLGVLRRLARSVRCYERLSERLGDASSEVLVAAISGRHGGSTRAPFAALRTSDRTSWLAKAVAPFGRSVARTAALSCLGSGRSECGCSRVSVRPAPRAGSGLVNQHVE